MEQVNWQTVLAAVVPVAIFCGTVWAQLASMKTQIASLEHWLSKVDGAEHQCPFVEVRTRNTTNIEQHERRLAVAERRLDVLEHRHEVENGHGE